MDKVRYGLVGFGGIAEHRIAREGFGLDGERFSGNANAILVAATDTAGSRREAAAALGIEWCPSVGELVARADIDAIIVATNNASHYGLAEMALCAGKHVFVEKPLATRADDALGLRRLASDRRLSLGVDHMMTQNAFNIEARRLVEEKAIGDVADICLHMEFLFGSTEAEAASWRCSRPDELGGPIGDVGSHCLYMAEFLTGSRISSIGCVYLPPTLGIVVENGAFIQFSMKNGLGGSARVAFNQARGGLSGTIRNLGYEIYGTGGALRSHGTLFQLSGHPDEPVKIGLELDRDGVVDSVSLSEPRNIYQAQISSHADSIIAGRPQDGWEGIRNLALLELCHDSARQGGAMLEVPERFA